MEGGSRMGIALNIKLTWWQKNMGPGFGASELRGPQWASLCSPHNNHVTICHPARLNAAAYFHWAFQNIFLRLWVHAVPFLFKNTSLSDTRLQEKRVEFYQLKYGQRHGETHLTFRSVWDQISGKWQRECDSAIAEQTVIIIFIIWKNARTGTVTCYYGSNSSIKHQFPFSSPLWKIRAGISAMNINV